MLDNKKISALTDEQQKQLSEVFRVLVCLSSATEKDNFSTCGCFHIKPFNTHWDETTVKEIIYHVRLYLDTWAIYPLEEYFGFDRKELSAELLLNWHKGEIMRLEFMKKQQSKK